MKRIQSLTLFFGLAATLMTASCSKEYVNPNAASDVSVLGSPKGLMGVAVGVQRTYALTIHPSMMSAVRSPTELYHPDARQYLRAASHGQPSAA